MINNTIKNLQDKIKTLESKISNLENKSLNIVNNLGFSIWTKNLLNINVINKKQITIKSIENKNKNYLFFQLKIRFLNYSSQIIKFDLFCDKIQVCSESQSFDNNISEITLSGTYQNLLSEKINVELSVTPKATKQVTLLNTVLTVWGVTQNYTDEYDALETSSEITLSYISNNRLYYKQFNKQSDANDSDFVFLNESISHSLCKDSNDQIYLFLVDTENNLFFGKLNNPHNVLISHNVSKVCSCNFNNSIYFSYISNGECFYGEIFNNIVISNKKITSIFGTFIDCYLYADNKNNKCYMILNKENGSNYLLQNTNNLCSSENILSEINLTISTEAGE